MCQAALPPIPDNAQETTKHICKAELVHRLVRSLPRMVALQVALQNKIATSPKRRLQRRTWVLYESIGRQKEAKEGFDVNWMIAEGARSLSCFGTARARSTVAGLP